MFYYESEDELYHYGRSKLDGAPGVGSGRYPLGSGDIPYQHSGDFLSYYDKYAKAGLSEKEIANKMGMSTTQLKVYKSYATNERRLNDIAMVKALKQDGLSVSEIGRRMGKNESSIRALLNTASEERTQKASSTAKQLMKIVDERGMIDVGKGVERELGISKNKLDEALLICEIEGYPVHGGRQEQVTNSTGKTTVTVLCPPGTEHKEIYSAMKENRISTVTDYHSSDGGDTFDKLQYPKSIDSKRVQIIFGDQGGSQKDGVIELRRGVEDISLGDSRYAQVRIAVDGTHYMKGMALYSDDLPPGIDVRFNTNKPSGTPKEKVFKELKDNPNNPFGATIKPVSAGGQRWYIDENGKKQLSVINKVKDEGDWDKYSDSLSAQFLAKQSVSLINKQLYLTYNNKVAEFEDIKNLTNPTVKKKLLEDFAEDCDGAAVHLRAAALPRQSWQVILPVPTLKDNEIYAHGYNQGETVCLVRYPHGGTFEIPTLKVNNRHPDAKKLLGQSIDAVGINSKVAERLSGADFDGDTVLVIPTNSKIKIRTKPPLKGLEGFDPKTQYSTDGKTGVRLMKKNETQKKMGEISNLITDMTIMGAPDDELARAVKHSMVVIDAEKHKLDYIQSWKDNQITQLKNRYQNGGGVATLLSRAKSPLDVPETRGSAKVNYDKKTGKAIRNDLPIGAVYYTETGNTYKKVKDPLTKKEVRVYTKVLDPVTGKLANVFEKDGKSYYKSNGEYKVVTKSNIVEEYYKSGDDFKKVTPLDKVKVYPATKKTTKMAATSDAHTLSSGTITEEIYANYANRMKSLANTARIEAERTPSLKYNPRSAQIYSNEVVSLKTKLDAAERNAPKERQANRIASAKFDAQVQSNPDMSKEEQKRARQQALDAARILVGAKKPTIVIEDKEWEAIQAGAIHDTTLKSILNNADSTLVKKLATPKVDNTKLTKANINRIKSMAAIGYSYSDIAKQLGISVSTIQKYVNQ